MLFTQKGDLGFKAEVSMLLASMSYLYARSRHQLSEARWLTLSAFMFLLAIKFVMDVTVNHGENNG
jgi:hypothetical protein